MSKIYLDKNNKAKFIKSFALEEDQKIPFYLRFYHKDHYRQ